MAKHIKAGRKRPKTPHKRPVSRPRRQSVDRSAGSLGALGAALGVSKVAVFKWTRRPDWPFGRKGPWDIEAVRAWTHQNLRPDPSEGYRPPAQGGSDLGRLSPLSKADLGVKLRRGKLLDMDILERQGRLHDTEVCRQHRIRQILDARAAFVDLPRAAAALLVGRDAGEIETLLGDKIEAILNRLAGGLQAPLKTNPPAAETDDGEESGDGPVSAKKGKRS